MTLPLVTVGIALYNHENYIEQCIQSVYTQTYQNIEIIVIDDGSKDNSYAVAKACLESPKNRCKYSVITRPNKGMCNTLNEIAKQANGKYISFIGSDDFWFKNKIEEQVAFLENNLAYALVHSNSMKVDSDGKPIKPIDYSAKINTGHVYEALIYRTGGINTPSHLHRTSVYDKIGYYDPQFSFEDTDFWLRFAKEFKVGFLNTCHTYYRWHGENLSDKKNALSFYYDELIRIYEKNITEKDLLAVAVKKMFQKKGLLMIKSGQVFQGLKYLIKSI